MNFRRGLSTRDEPEINLIPLIDVLLVILIFLMVTTTYTRYTALKVNLPTADAEKAVVPPRQIVVSTERSPTVVPRSQETEAATDHPPVYQ